MAFPTVESTAVSGDATATTSHAFTLPSGIVNGDLIVGICSMDNGGAAEFTWPGGGSPWTELVEANSGTAYAGSVAFRRATGSESGTITVTSVTSERASATLYRISGHHGTTDPEAGGASGSDINPDPPSLNPSGWGAEDTLWIAAMGGDKQANTHPATDDPDSYTDAIEAQVSNDNWTRSLRRELNAASEDPTTFTMTAADDWVAFTVAIRPAPAVAVSIPFVTAPYRQP